MNCCGCITMGLGWGMARLLFYGLTPSTAADGTKTVRVSQYGRMISETRYNAAAPAGQISQVTFGYDAHGRQNARTDARNGTTSFTFNNADQVVTITSPSVDAVAQTTVNFYDNMGRETGTRSPDGLTKTNLYFPTGLLKKTWGARTYPVEYGYDLQGRLRTLKTWQSFSPSGGVGTATTLWVYDQHRGWLTGKYYPGKTTGVPGSIGTVYDYTSGGRLKTRTWQRGVVTTYIYGFDDHLADNEHSDLVGVQYTPSTTPAVTYAYDRRGRRSQVQHNGMTTGFTYNDADQQLTETFSSGVLNGLAVSTTYDAALRRDQLSLNTQPSALAVTYDYNDAGQLETVTEGGSIVTYGYLDNSPLVEQIAFSHASQARMTTTKQHDRLNRLERISSTAQGSASPSLPLTSGYVYNIANQRIRSVASDGSYWIYTYDGLGQVTSGIRYWQDGTPVAGQQFVYAHDDIGNRKETYTGGDASGGSLRQASYTVNRLNQYDSRTVTNVVDILGIANPTAAVTVNGNTANRKGEYFWYGLSTPNSSQAWYGSVTVNSTYPPGQSESGNIFVPKTPEVFDYDLDGNLTNDGRWFYTWDGENRLVKMEPSGTVTPPTGSRRKLEFAYDHQSRRIWQKITNLDTNEVKERVFVYDGWNLIATLTPQHAVINAFVWGLDLSGSFQGAGGVGGLLKVTYKGAQTTNCFAAFDGNGNVLGLIDAANGGLLARYEYGPFGELLRATGPMAKANPFRFSTKYQNDETDLVYYGYRYYNASTGRWLSRDPAGEQAFARYHPGYGRPPTKRRTRLSEPFEHDYLFVRACPLNSFDLLGLKQYDASGGTISQGLSNGHNMSPGDTVINSSEVSLINVHSGNLETSNDPDFAKAKCVLRQIKLPLPTSENGVYWGSWNDPNLNAVTVEWSGLWGSDINYTFIANSHQGASRNCDRRFIEFLVTLYHEVKGHNIDEQSHDTAEETAEFNKKYEDTVRNPLLQKELSDACCRVCKVGQ